MHKNQKSLLPSRHIRYNLKISFYLMAALPLLVCVYLLSNYVFPHTPMKLDIIVLLFITIIFLAIGFLVLKEVFDRIISVSTEARLIANGDISHKIDIDSEDEVGELEKSLIQLTQRIRQDMEELKNYSAKSSEINLEIQRRTFALLNLLQISSLISQGEKLDNLCKIIVEKSRLLFNCDVAYLFSREEDKNIFYVKAADGLNSEGLLKVRIGEKDSVFDKLIGTDKPLILDRGNVLPETLSAFFYDKFNLKNALVLPIYLKGKTIGLLGIGDAKETVSYKRDDIELLDIFAKQIGVALENDILTHRIEQLEIKDALTGLYNATFIRGRLEEEIRRAVIYRRPCAFILLDIDNFQGFSNNFGALQSEGALKKIASLIKEPLSEIDRVARTGDNEFAIVLPERNKRQAQLIAEDIRGIIESNFSKEQDINKRLTASGGVSENPLDGINAEQLIAKAKILLDIAKQQGKNRIVI